MYLGSLDFGYNLVSKNIHKSLFITLTPLKQNLFGQTNYDFMIL